MRAAVGSHKQSIPVSNAAITYLVEAWAYYSASPWTPACRRSPAWSHSIVVSGIGVKSGIVRALLVIDELLASTLFINLRSTIFQSLH